MNFGSIIIDDNTMLHSAIYWPKGAEINTMLEAVSTYIFSILKECDIKLNFDQYQAFGIKPDIMRERKGASIKDHKFTEVTPLPTKESVFCSTKNKAHLNS